MSERIPAPDTLAEILAVTLRLKRNLHEYVEALDEITADDPPFSPDISLCFAGAHCAAGDLRRLVSSKTLHVRGWPIPETPRALNMIDKALVQLAADMSFGSGPMIVVNKLSGLKGRLKSDVNALVVDSIDDWPRPSERVGSLLDGAIERLTAVLMLDGIEPLKIPNRIEPNDVMVEGDDVPKYFKSDLRNKTGLADSTLSNYATKAEIDASSKTGSSKYSTNEVIRICNKIIELCPKKDPRKRARDWLETLI